MGQESIENGSGECQQQAFCISTEGNEMRFLTMEICCGWLLIVQVKSVLDPCEDENDDLLEDEEVNLGADSMQEDNSSSDSEVLYPVFL